MHTKLEHINTPEEGEMNEKIFLKKIFKKIFYEGIILIFKF